MPIGSIKKALKSKRTVVDDQDRRPQIVVAPKVEIALEPVVDTNTLPDINVLPKNIIITSANEAQAGYKLTPDGKAQKFDGVDWVDIKNEWLIRGSADEYEIRMTYNKYESKGSYSFSGKIGTWVDLSTARQWVSYAKGIESTLNVTLYLEIRKKGEKISVTAVPVTLSANTFG